MHPTVKPVQNPSSVSNSGRSSSWERTSIWMRVLRNLRVSDVGGPFWAWGVDEDFESVATAPAAEADEVVTVLEGLAGVHGAAGADVEAAAAKFDVGHGSLLGEGDGLDFEGFGGVGVGVRLGRCFPGFRPEQAENSSPMGALLDLVEVVSGDVCGGVPGGHFGCGEGVVGTVPVGVDEEEVGGGDEGELAIGRIAYSLRLSGVERAVSMRVSRALARASGSVRVSS
ncbi:MAG: hypothetical protein ACHQ7N_18470 [Candidatus Methylomirabilales bacterium]